MRTTFYALLVVLACTGCGPQQRRGTPEMVIAVKLARASLTNFVSTLQSSQSNLTFCQVCAPLQSNATSLGDCSWVNVWSYDGTSFMGRVVSGYQTGFTNNQLVTIPAAAVIDWSYLSETGVVGRFTERVHR
jgi:hypothetical protein